MDADTQDSFASENPRVLVLDEEDSIDEAGDPATQDEKETLPVAEEIDDLTSASKVAMAEFLRVSSEQLEKNEFVVLVVLQPDNVRHRVLVTAQTTVEKLRAVLCTDLHLVPAFVTFPNICTLAEDEANVPLSALGIHAECTIEAFVATRPVTSNYVMPARLQVQVYNEKTDSTSLVSVEIEKFTGRKVYLGGYKNRKTLQQFHHASTQTIVLQEHGQRRRLRHHRDTQTQILVTRSVQTSRESGTQMARRDLLLDEAYDRYVTARSYVDSYQFKQRQEDAVLFLQRMWRGYQARHMVLNLRDQRRRQKERFAMAKRQHQAQESARQRRDIARRMHPTSAMDFEILYNELAKWRQDEGHKIRNLQLDGAERQRAMDGILTKETKLLQTIDRLKATATDANRKQRIDAMLNFLARPKQWQMRDGAIKEVHTPFTVRAKELMELYHGLRTPLSSVDERLEMLLHVKWTVQEFECALTREVIELIDREADMLSRGRKEQSLEGLRKRLTNLFLQFIETPEFNPEVTALKQAR